MDQLPEAARSLENGARHVRCIAGREIVFDSEGFLWDPLQWTEEVARDLAHGCGLAVLTDTHWRVINFLREYYSQYGRAPLHRQLKSGTGLRGSTPRP